MGVHFPGLVAAAGAALALAVVDVLALAVGAPGLLTVAAVEVFAAAADFAGACGFTVT